MITEQDLREAIAECQGVKNPTANTCIKLAAYYIILDHVGTKETALNPSMLSMFSKASTPHGNEPVIIDSDSEFAEAIRGKSQDDAWAVMDELMDTIRVIQPRLYDSVMNKIKL